MEERDLPEVCGVELTKGRLNILRNWLGGTPENEPGYAIFISLVNSLMKRDIVLSLGNPRLEGMEKSTVFWQASGSYQTLETDIKSIKEQTDEAIELIRKQENDEKDTV